MPKYTYALDNGKSLTLEGDTQPADSDVEQAAKSQGVTLLPAGYVPPTGSIAERNAQARANMAKQHEAQDGKQSAYDATRAFVNGVEQGTGGGVLGAIARNGPGKMLKGGDELWTPGSAKKGAHDLITGTGTTAALAFAPEILANPVTAAGAVVLGAGGDALGHKAATALGADADTANLVGDATGLAGGVVGGNIAKEIPVAPAIRFLGKRVSAPGGLVNTLTGELMTAGANAGEEVGNRLRGPLQNVLQPSGQAADAARTAALDDAAKIVQATKDAQQVEATRTNKRMLADKAAADKAAALAKKNAPPVRTGPSLEDLGVVQTADAVAASNLPRPEPTRLPIPDNNSDRRAALLEQLAERMGLQAPQGGEDANVPMPEGGRAADVQGAGQERIVDKPLYQQQQLLEEHGSPDNTPEGPGRLTTLTHTQTGVGGRGSETAVPDGKNARPGVTSITQVDEGPTTNNASAQGGSAEENGRVNSLKAAKQYRVVTRGGEVVRIISDAGGIADSNTVRPGETLGTVTMTDGKAPVPGMRIGARPFEVREHGTKAGPITAQERFVAGSRTGKNGSTQQQRVDAFRAAVADALKKRTE